MKTPPLHLLIIVECADVYATRHMGQGVWVSALRETGAEGALLLM